MTENTGKMRDWILRLYTPNTGELKVQGLDILDEIEREIAERYIELPVDADGVPIHELDTLYDRDGKEFVVTTLVVDGGWTVKSWGKPGRPQNYRHAKPRTVEDAARDFVNSVVTFNGSRDGIPVVGIDNSLWRDYFPEFADELRELLGVGE